MIVPLEHGGRKRESPEVGEAPDGRAPRHRGGQHLRNARHDPPSPRFPSSHAPPVTLSSHRRLQRYHVTGRGASFRLTLSSALRTDKCLSPSSALSNSLARPLDFRIRRCDWENAASVRGDGGREGGVGTRARRWTTAASRAAAISILGLGSGETDGRSAMRSTLARSLARLLS